MERKLLFVRKCQNRISPYILPLIIVPFLTIIFVRCTFTLHCVAALKLNQSDVHQVSTVIAEEINHNSGVAGRFVPLLALFFLIHSYQ